MSEKQNIQDLAERQESLKLQFIHSELDLALTFCQVAGTTGNRETAGRNTENARRAYEVADTLSTGAALRVADRQEVEGKLTQLQGMLAHLDERGEGLGKKADGSR